MTERLAVYPGVFDPPTLAHLALIAAALGLFDRLVVVVAVNPRKPAAVFAPEERVALLRESLKALPVGLRTRVDVRAYAGVIAPFAQRLGASALVRGMRPVSDPEVEIAQALMNAKLAPALPTVLLVAPAEYVYLSSTFVRDLAQLEGLIVPGTVPPAVERALRARFGPPPAGPVGGVS
jgi:pantetheine-phosphate adenylyltransferase